MTKYPHNLWNYLLILLREVHNNPFNNTYNCINCCGLVYTEHIGYYFIERNCHQLVVVQLQLTQF